ncbi:DUF2806 domain-containing protein [Clostridium butyricum]|uniref:DUF2806 domain-containing protein n=1 Tax=Clostridium butyricum TaxID=1492 RepID=UPI00189ECE81|nr:DUF2806 domain-containing protein [Clostridium butyricum]MDB2151184.1 DUF2806 domain-containing protein [Clostridium butyricum]
MGENESKFLIGDLAGLSEPMTKFIEVVSSAVGGIFKPHQKRRMAKATSDEIKTLSEAVKDIKGKVILKNGEWEINLDSESVEGRSLETLIAKEVKKQVNIESIIYKAKDLIEEKKTVSKEEVNQDWITKFFNKAQDVSDEQMQNLWAKILSDEIEKPKSYSLRTLELISNLSADEAKLITEFCKYAFSYSKEVCIIGNMSLLDKYGIGADEFVLLKDLGIAEFSTPSIFQRFTISFKDYGNLRCGDILFQIENVDKSNEVTITIIPFTTTGSEIYRLTAKGTELEYLKDVAGFIREENEKSTVKIHITDLCNNQTQEL